MKYVTSILIFLCLISSCGKKVHTDSETKPSVVLTAPNTLHLSQRSTTEIPGSEGKVLITIGDITRSQVAVSVSWDKGESLVGTRSLQEGDEIELEIEGTRYKLKLSRLTNELVGDDSAEFSIEKINTDKDEANAGITSKQEIDNLIRCLGDLNEASFIRNGVEYSVEDAIDHLNGKLSAAGTSIKTAEDFIEVIASKSSSSGKSYQIRLQDGTVVTTQEWFTERLKEIRKNHNTL